MDNRPIGIFDSGLGGLTTVRELRRLMPGEDIVYFGDTGRVPYGTRGRETIRKYCRQDIRFLLSQQVKMIIVACNTAAASLAGEEKTFGLLSAEALTPAVDAACRITRNNRVAVICTAASAKSGAYQRALRQQNPRIEVLTIPCPLFVPLVENGFTQPDNPVTRMVAQQYLAPLKEFQGDTLILGCTHYPVIKEVIRAVVGEGISLIDSGQEAARSAKAALQAQKMENGSGALGKSRYYVSDNAEDFAETARQILGEPIDGGVLQIDIESY